jgi:hypothetical protein
MDNRTGIATAIIISFLVIALCVASGFVGHSYGQETNYSAGYQAGQKVNSNQQYDKGKEEGFKAGYEAKVTANTQKPDIGYYLKNPSYEEMKTFLSKDISNSKPYVESQHICADYSAEVVNNAKTQGIRCAFVYIIYPQNGHTIIAFETTDKGLKFIEPQFDKEVALVIGKSYSQLNNFTAQPINDTVERYLIIW